jgi:hypothetical protein
LILSVKFEKKSHEAPIFPPFCAGFDRSIHSKQS